MTARPETLQFTRSRTGCQQCRRASRKCDEARPICSRCQRLQKECDYSRHLIWRSKPVTVSTSSIEQNAGTPVAVRPIAANSDHARLAVADHITPIADEKLSLAACRSTHKHLQLYPLTLRYEVVSGGHNLLHFSSQTRDWLLMVLLPQVEDIPAIKAGIVALMALYNAPSEPSLSTFDCAIKSLKEFLSSPAALDQPAVMFHAAILMSQLSVSIHLHT